MRVLLNAALLAIAAACSQQVSTFPPEESASQTTPTPSSTETSPTAQMPAWDAARTQGVDFRGVGQEPGWMLDIYQTGRIVLLWDYGEQTATFPLTSATYPQEGATQYATRTSEHALTVTIRRYPCQDSMSGEAFPATVEVAIDGRTLSGCGRTV